VFKCGLLECLNLPWLAASPDGVAVLNVSAGQVLATVEVKTRVSTDQIASAEQLAAKYVEDSGPILCTVGDDVWKEVVDKDHSTQIMVQLSVLKLKYCIYIVGQAGVRGAMGRIIYVVIGTLQLDDLLQFVDKMRDTFEDILNPFFTSGTLDEMVKLLPDGMMESNIKILETCWMFFTDMRNHLEHYPNYAFPSTSVFKTEVQSLYNTLKGGLDANSQQFPAICPYFKTKFENKYVIRLLFAVVSSSWRAFKMVNSTVDVDNFSLHLYRKHLSNTFQSLKDFTYNLGIGLLQSMSNPYFQNVLFSETTRMRMTTGTNCHLS
jgi:hypothetical protein